MVGDHPACRLVATLLAMAIGCTLGFTAAIAGGVVDTILARAVEPSSAFRA